MVHCWRRRAVGLTGGVDEHVVAQGHVKTPVDRIPHHQNTPTWSQNPDTHKREHTGMSTENDVGESVCARFTPPHWPTNANLSHSRFILYTIPTYRILVVTGGPYLQNSSLLKGSSGQVLSSGCHSHFRPSRTVQFAPVIAAVSASTPPNIFSWYTHECSHFCRGWFQGFLSQGSWRGVGLRTHLPRETHAMPSRNAEVAEGVVWRVPGMGCRSGARVSDRE